MNIGIIVQARMGSTRLPGKILRPFYQDKSILDILLDKLHNVEGTKIIVATSTSPNNDELEKYLLQRGEQVYRGSENDVLARFIGAAETYGIDAIIRICSDNPFIDYEGVNLLIEKAKESDADYIGFQINGMPSIKTHFGFWGEYVTLDALKKVRDTSDDGIVHEHVTIYIYTHPDEYCCKWVECPEFLQGRDDIRLTIDTEKDMENAQTVFSNLSKENESFGLRDVVTYLESHTELRQSMEQIIAENSK